MSEHRDNSRPLIKNILAGIIGGAIGARYSQDGPLAPPKGSLRAAIYKQGMTPAKRQQALDFLVELESRDPFGLTRLQGAMTNDDLFNMLQHGDPSDWRRSIPPSTLVRVQTVMNTFTPPKPKTRWSGLRKGLRFVCIVLIVFLTIWFVLKPY